MYYLVASSGTEMYKRFPFAARIEVRATQLLKASPLILLCSLSLICSHGFILLSGLPATPSTVFPQVFHQLWKTTPLLSFPGWDFVPRPECLGTVLSIDWTFSIAHNFQTQA